jgi:hypothetical protein
MASSTMNEITRGTENSSPSRKRLGYIARPFRPGDTTLMQSVALQVAGILTNMVRSPTGNLGVAHEV